MGLGNSPDISRSAAESPLTGAILEKTEPSMVHAKFVLATFSREMDAAVRALWGQLESAGFETPQRENGIPHLSLGGVEALDVAHFQEAFLQNHADMPGVEVALTHVGIFGAGKFVWLGAPTNPELLDLHRKVDGAMRSASSHVPDAMYQPGAWIPHCTLAHNVPPEKMQLLFEIVSSASLPLRGSIESLELKDVSYPR